jgi:hypothetical protein
MNNEPKMHLWIPDEEVRIIEKTIRGGRKERPVLFSEHGSKLSHNLQTIKELTEQSKTENSLREKDIMVFNVELPEKVKIQDRPDIFSSNGMEIKAVRNERNAVVASTKTQFQKLKERIESYTSNGAFKSCFDYVESFEPFIGAIKDSNGLQKVVLQETPPETVDIQLMLIPDLDSSFYESALKLLLEKIKMSNGSVPDSIYYLSDNTPVVRAIIPSSMLSLYENDQAIYRIEKTNFFDVDADSTPVSKLEGLTLNQDVNFETLPTVAILDSGVIFPHDFENLIVQHWIATGSKGGNAIHGTITAGNVVFRYITQNIRG